MAIGEGDRSGDTIAAIRQLNGMLREKGWRPSDAQVCELARMLAEHVPPRSGPIGEASGPT